MSIDGRLLARIERLRTRTGESRSAVVSRALARLTADDLKAREVARYQEAYRAKPESAEEIDTARASARRTLSHLDWDAPSDSGET